MSKPRHYNPQWNTDTPTLTPGLMLDAQEASVLLKAAERQEAIGEMTTFEHLYGLTIRRATEEEKEGRTQRQEHFMPQNNTAHLQQGMHKQTRLAKGLRLLEED